MRLIVFAIVSFIILKATTFGWRFWSRSHIDTVRGDSKLSKQLKEHVYRLSHEIGERSLFKYEKLNEAAEYIINQFSSFGYNVEFQDYVLWNRTSRNIIATKTGTEKPEHIIIIGAHYDTCFNPGADDNASAVAGLLELARLLYAKETNCTIRFIAFTNEEPPIFKTDNMGSRVYAKQVRVNGENIKAVLILEMIGYYTDKPHSQKYPPILGIFYPNKGNYIMVVGNFTSRKLVKKVTAAFKNKSRFPVESLVASGIVPGVDFSDHWSFWKEGYSAVMITDTAFYRYPHYHSNSDTYEKLDYGSMSEVVRGFEEVLIEITK